MNDINSVVIGGDLHYMPVTEYTERGTPYATFAIRTLRYYHLDNVMRQETNIIPAIAWNDLADRIQDHASEHQKARLVGRLQSQRWIDENQVEHLETRLVVEHIELGSIPQKSAIWPLENTEAL